MLQECLGLHFFRWFVQFFHHGDYLLPVGSQSFILLFISWSEIDQMKWFLDQRLTGRVWPRHFEFGSNFDSRELETFPYIEKLPPLYYSYILIRKNQFHFSKMQNGRPSEMCRNVSNNSLYVVECNYRFSFHL